MFLKISGGTHIGCIHAEVVAVYVPLLHNGPFSKWLFLLRSSKSFFSDALTDHKHKEITKNSSPTAMLCSLKFSGIYSRHFFAQNK